MPEHARAAESIVRCPGMAPVPPRYRDRHLEFVRQTRHRTVTGIQIHALPRRGGQRVRIAVISAHGIAIGSITGRATEFFDPRMLVRRNGLRGELPADPVRLFGEDDSHPIAQRGESGRKPPTPPPITAMSQSSSLPAANRREAANRVPAPLKKARRSSVWSMLPPASFLLRPKIKKDERRRIAPRRH